MPQNTGPNTSEPETSGKTNEKSFFSKESILQYLLDHPTKLNLQVMSRLFNTVIPFNGPHQFRIEGVSSDEISVRIPFSRKNKNHLGGVHAGAIATLGELAAGIGLFKNFGGSRYRFILSDLFCKYLYQGKTDLIATVSVDQDKINSARKELAENGKCLLDLETIIKDKNANEVAKVISSWQIKDWKKVKTKT